MWWVGVSTGRVCARPRLNSKLSGGWKRNLKSTRNASRIERFGSCRVLGCIADDVILAGSVEIWLDHDEISPNLVKFGLDLDGILPDLVRSGLDLDLDEISLDLMGFQVIFVGELQIPSVFVSFRWKSFEYHRRFLVFRSSGSGFGGGNLPIDLKGVGFCGGDLQSTSKWLVWAVSGLGSGGLLGLVDSLGWVDSPSGELQGVKIKLWIYNFTIHESYY